MNFKTSSYIKIISKTSQRYNMDINKKITQMWYFSSAPENSVLNQLSTREIMVQGITCHL
jgi:hypothetical protein